MVGSLFSCNKKPVKGQGNIPEKESPVKTKTVYNIVNGRSEAWEDDGNPYTVVDYNFVTRVLEGAGESIYLGEVNYFRRCYGLPTQKVNEQSEWSGYLLAAWVYDKCKDIQ